jgi:hypothetical protein
LPKRGEVDVLLLPEAYATGFTTQNDREVAAKSADAVEFLAGMIDVKKMSLTADGKLDGFESQLEALKGSKKGLFATVTNDSPEPQGGGDAPDALMAKIQAKFNS